MSDLVATLKAGGLVPHDAKLDKAEAVDTVVARAYRHPALPGRTVIRLTAKSTAAGDDLEMSTLGFGGGVDKGAVAKERRRPLGFPGWALVHDPKNARFALDVVKEFKKHARKAKSKPGHAKEGIDAIAVRLAKTVPHFLPSFFEEAGRAFIEHGAQTFAAAMFGKARDAEAVHALDIDEQHRVDGFLEFALAGAVTTKALTQYAKDLGDSHEPKVAYAHFRQLCLQRTLGGMPPWAGMAKELRRLAKAAKLDADAEDAALIAEVIESPALGKAAAEFWRAYAAPIVELAKRSASARTALLDLFPTGTSSQAAEIDEAWLDLLERSGAVDALIHDVPDVKPAGGRAAWFDKLTQHVARGWRSSMINLRAFDLLVRMARALAADGAAITCTGRYGRIDLDLVDLALELGVPIKLPEPHRRIDLDDWAKRASAPIEPAHATHVGRDPVRAAAHPLIGPILAEAVAGEIGDEPFDTVARAKQGFTAAKRTWLDAQIARAEARGLPALVEVLDTIDTKVKASLFAEFPELHARFVAVDVAPVLARSLRIGIIDELGWPALEDAFAELVPDDKTKFSLHGGLPALIVVTATKAIAVGPHGRLGVHDLVLPPKHELVTVRFIGGHFLVVRKHSWNKLTSYWDHAPHDAFELEMYSSSVPTIANRVAVLADGAWVEGHTTIRAGDRTVPSGALASHDGTTAWIVEHKDGQAKMREVSAAGEAGRFSWPAFLEAGAVDDWKIEGGSYVVPAPPGLTSSPLGIRDGMLGIRIRFRGEPRTVTARELESIDGNTWSATLDIRPSALLRLPGAGEPRPVTEEHSYRELSIGSIIDPAGTVRGSRITVSNSSYWRGSPCVLPPALWHALVPRDEAGSRALRAITDDDARAMVAALAVKTAEQLAAELPRGAVTTQLPAITNARLVAGVAGLVTLAAECVRKRDRLAAERAPGKAVTVVSTVGPDDASLGEALAGWIETSRGSGRAWTQIERVADWFAAADRGDRIDTETAGSAVDWLPLAPMPSALALIAVAIGTPADKRGAVADLLGLLAERMPAPVMLRVFQAVGSEGMPNKELVLRWHGGNAYAIRRAGWYGNQFEILEYAPAQTWQVPPGYQMSGEGIRGAGSVGAGEVDAVRSALSRGATSWSDTAAARIAAATGLTESEGALLWAGSPSIESRETNFLDKELREQIGLKAAQASLARDTLKAISQFRRLALADTTARMGVAALLDGSAADNMAAAFVTIVGKRIAVPEELIADADREIKAPMQPNAALRMIASDDTSPLLNVDGNWALDPDGDVIAVSNPEPLVGQTKLAEVGERFGANVLHTAVCYLPFLYAELPVGDPLRARAVSAHGRVLARLAYPGLLIDETGSQWLDDAGKLVADKLLDAIGGDVVTGLAEGTAARVIPGAIVVRGARYLKLRVRPATLDAAAIPTVSKVSAQISSWGHSVVKSIDYVRSADLAAMMARIDVTPVPAGGWEQNPFASVPKLVDKMAKKLDVSRDAAGIYAIFLVALWPSAKNIQLWTGWKPKQLESALAELVDAELVIEAKRERAQRGHFLPGGWEALKSPLPPLESWKVPLYATRTVEGAIALPHQQLFATAPFHLLYERAWKRIESGDVPKYDEVKR